MPSSESSRSAFGPSTLVGARALLALAFTAALCACNNTATVPITMAGSACSTDDDCDPGDNCVNGNCVGDSAGMDGGDDSDDAGDGDDGGLNDAGADDAGMDDGGAADAGAQDGGPGDAGTHDGGSSDAGTHDGGSSDAGTHDGGTSDGGSDAGTPEGVLGLSPLHSTDTATAGTQAPPVVLSVSNSGNAALHWTATCTNGAVPTPASAALAAGGTASLSVALPKWTVGGAQSVSCTVSTADGSGGPLTAVIAITISGTPAGVTTSGGAVDLLDFTFTGDTRPANCDDAKAGPGPYPQAIFESILTQMSALQPQFGFDLGDHMYVCSGTASVAKANMKLYTDALAAKWPKSLAFLMTMGNHECEKSDCSGKNDTDVNYVAYAAALKSVSDQSLPYYSMQIKTRLGRATFVFIADHYFDSTAESWLKSTLKDADANSAYTFVIKHYPVTGSRAGPSSITGDIEAHHYSLVITAHEHDYKHDTSTSPWSGRSMICGLGGASSSTGDEGFCRVQQRADGTLLFTHYGLTGNPGDSWSVTARQ